LPAPAGPPQKAKNHPDNLKFLSAFSDKDLKTAATTLKSLTDPEDAAVGFDQLDLIGDTNASSHQHQRFVA
jgi:hypothetical protein